MPAKKSAKKATKWIAKTAARRHPAHDVRRAYEHLGRVDILEGALAGAHFRQVSALASLAQQQLVAGYARDAADLFRAAEHICFAALAPQERPTTATLVSPELKEAIATELDQLTSRAQEQWSSIEDNDPHEMVAAIYTAALEQAGIHFSAGAYRPALELARAAEVLAVISTRPSIRRSVAEPARRLAS